MPLWGKSTSTESRPKWLGGDGAEGASGRKEDAYAVPAGWALKPGQINSGNDNTSADPEVIACVSDVTGLSAALGAANILSVDFVAGEYARAETFDVVLTYDEAITVTSVAWSADQVYSNKVNFVLQNYGPTDMDNDGSMRMQYFSGSGTNRLVFRGTIPATAAAGGYLGDTEYNLNFDGSSTMEDGNGTTVPAGDMAGATPLGGPGADAELFTTSALKTGSSVVVETTQAGTSSGSKSILTGVHTSVDTASSSSSSSQSSVNSSSSSSETSSSSSSV